MAQIDPNDPEKRAWEKVTNDLGILMGMVEEMVIRRHEHPDMMQVCDERIKIIEMMGQGMLTIAKELRSMMDEDGLHTFAQTMRDYLSDQKGGEQ